MASRYPLEGQSNEMDEVADGVGDVGELIVVQVQVCEIDAFSNACK